MKDVFDLYLTGAVLYGMLHLLAGNLVGMGRITVTWLGNKTWHFPNLFAVIPLIILWPIVFPVQIYQYRRERREVERERREHLGY